MSALSSGPFARPLCVEELDSGAAHGFGACPGPWPDLAERVRAAPTPFLLETGSDPTGQEAWQFLGAHPIGSARAVGTRWQWSMGAEKRAGDGDPWGALRAWGATWQAAPVVGARPAPAPFAGGAVGYLSYELGELLEGLPPRPVAPRTSASGAPGATDAAGAAGAAALDATQPLYHFHLYDEVVVVERASGRAWWLHRDRPNRAARAWWRTPARAPQDLAPALRRIGVSIEDARYLECVRELRAAIGRGDVYEVNLTRRHELAGGPGPWDLHRRLARLQPVPHAAVLPWQPVAVVSASPELLLRRRGTRVVTRPIKGTAPRGATPREDEALAAALLASPKERAELAMIVDLARNDLGKRCRPGSVEVVDPTALERYPTVFQTVATVAGELPAGSSSWDLIAAVFPGGSITGAPKSAALREIRRHEPVPRGVYTGSIGWLAPDGDLDLNIAIRTVLYQEDRVCYSVGGAITWDSDPLRELAELAAKGRAIEAALTTP